jgi:ribosomal protein L7Ae-like RNA K-turn-binding protein
MEIPKSRSEFKMYIKQGTNEAHKRVLRTGKNLILAAKDHTINTEYVSQAIYYTYDGIVIVNHPLNTTHKSKNEKLES